ncbi:hypothetical protein GCM10007941_30420 [Amphritea balenae]|nr:hypothetical protein GCM10007941_30420 [Amphritea balenae]
MPVWLYQPVTLVNKQRIIVAVHGISRDSEEQVREYCHLADRLGCWLVAPEFSAQAYPRYQQLARASGYPRADLALNSFLALWRGVVSQPGLKMYLAGYSGGAQFAHRYAMHHPQQVAALVLSSAGWYSFPDRKRDYPCGIANSVGLNRVRLNELLQLPMLVTVGEQDLARDGSLRISVTLDQQQGSNRFERAVNWSQAVRKLQLKKSYRPVQLTVLGGQSHSFINNMQQGRMAELILNFLQQSEGERNEKISYPVGSGNAGKYCRMSG